MAARMSCDLSGSRPIGSFLGRTASLLSRLRCMDVARDKGLAFSSRLFLAVSFVIIPPCTFHKRTQFLSLRDLLLGQEAKFCDSAKTSHLIHQEIRQFGTDSVSLKFACELTGRVGQSGLFACDSIPIRSAPRPIRADQALKCFTLVFFTLLRKEIEMELVLCKDSVDLGQRAAAAGAAKLREALAQQGSANIIVATGASQFETLAALLKETDIDWTRVTAFHLDEYIGLPVTHPASFRKFLHERFVDLVPLKAFHEVQADAADPYAECQRLGELISRETIDVAFMGIGENAHIAFNDPPADFETEVPYLVVDLDEACRKQQLGEGWFPTLDDVPKQAISMSVRQILKSRNLIISVPDARKATAVKNSVEGPVTPEVPGSILQQHPSAALFIDPPAAQELTRAE